MVTIALLRLVLLVVGRRGVRSGGGCSQESLRRFAQKTSRFPRWLRFPPNKMEKSLQKAAFAKLCHIKNGCKTVDVVVSWHLHSGANFGLTNDGVRHPASIEGI